MSARRQPGPTDMVKQQVAAHWNRRASHFDEDFGHSIRTPGERAACDRILDLVVDALDVGCGTLTFELATRGHRVTGVPSWDRTEKGLCVDYLGRAGTL